MTSLHLTTLQITLKSTHGKAISVSHRFGQNDLRAYRDLIKETLEGLGLSVEFIAFGYDNCPVGYEIQPVEAGKKEPVKPKVIEPEPESDLASLPQYQGRPKIWK